MKLTQKQLQKMILREMKILMKETVEDSEGAANKELVDLLIRRDRQSNHIDYMHFREGDEEVYRYQIYAQSGIKFVTSDAPGKQEGFVINIHVPKKKDDV